MQSSASAALALSSGRACLSVLGGVRVRWVCYRRRPGDQPVLQQSPAGLSTAPCSGFVRLAVRANERHKACRQQRVEKCRPQPGKKAPEPPRRPARQRRLCHRRLKNAPVWCGMPATPLSGELVHTRCGQPRDFYPFMFSGCNNPVNRHFLYIFFLVGHRLIE